MNLIFLGLFICGVLIVALAWYRGRGETNKRYSWLSYLSIGLPAVVIVLMYIIPKSTILFISTPIGSPIAFIVSVIALFKRREKHLLAVLGLCLSLILLGFVIIYGIFLINPYQP
ncbi:hypothetical protein MUN89_06015 [Halobacillus salinarum]|uniref:Uncharacterized protein n=1 Tax=Halobacillus salinarum TaxID=2932257 RepID=A0ABY4ENT3_9BACI|nr:hypothetical protein [Halobacillus salinarum]UOQ45498.1 hypothetical protein MUN89_06015 [Halobacillus salinarum]